MKKRKSVSIREVARTLKVAPSTVSRVMNDSGNNVAITQATRQRVLHACEALGYQPNVHARRLFARRSGVIAVVVPPPRQHPSHYADACLGRVLASVSDTARVQGRDLLLVTADDAFVSSGRHLALFREGSIDGMLVWGAFLTHTYVHDILKEGHPVVLLRTCLADKQVPHVVSDDRGGSVAIAHHLLRLGHRHLGYVSGPEAASVALDRHMGFEEACRQAGARLTRYQGDFTYERGFAIGSQIFRGGDRPTAVATANDTMALGVIEAARQADLSVPGDVSVVGADGAYPMFRPQLTTFEVPEEEIGRRGVELLMKAMERVFDWEALRRSGENVLPYRLVPGETAAPPQR